MRGRGAAHPRLRSDRVDATSGGAIAWIDERGNDAGRGPMVSWDMCKCSLISSHRAFDHVPGRSGRQVPLTAILRDDGAVVRQNGTRMRASTGTAPESTADAEVLFSEPKAEGMVVLRDGTEKMLATLMTGASGTMRPDRAGCDAGKEGGWPQGIWAAIATRALSRAAAARRQRAPQ